MIITRRLRQDSMCSKICAPGDRALGMSEIVFNALHGAYGEDGGVQGLLGNLGYNYTGSARLASAIAYNKVLAKRVLQKAGLNVPAGVEVDTNVDPYTVAEQLFRELGGQYVIKPVLGSMSQGVRVVRSYEDLVPSIVDALWENENILIEEVVRGKEVKIGVIDRFRGEEYYTLLPIEILKDNDLNIYRPIGGNNFVVPGRFSKSEKELLSQTAVTAHKAIGARGYSMIDIILTRRFGRNQGHRL